MTDAEIWQDRLERWSTSGLTAGQFAAREGITEARLFYWKKKFSQPAAPRMVPVRVGNESSAKGQAVPRMLEVIIDEQVTVRVPADFEERTLARLVRVLGVVR